MAVLNGSYFQRHAFPTAHTAPHSCLSARTMCVSSLSGNVMATTTVETIQMRSCTSAVSQHKHSQVVHETTACHIV